jgi:UDP-2,3-diacylglucosamine hydrolase
VATLFIADLHLQTEEPAITAGFLRFYRRSPQADALYILGDLFEAWIGDDDPNPLHQQIASAINALTIRRALLLHSRQPRFSRRPALRPRKRDDAAAGRKVLDLYGRRVLIMHGDTLCTDDPGYLAFRAKVHTPWIQRLFLALPLFIRRRIAARMRADSKAANSSKSLEIMDVNPQAVVDALERHQVQWLIHGHTHRPAVHPLEANGKPAFRVVLGAWHSEGSMVKVKRRR